jgi:hypothetical protein
MGLVEMAGEVASVPKIEELTFSGTLNADFEALRKKVSQVPFYTTKMDGGTLVLARVESRGINKKPYLFYMIKICGNAISVVYSIPHDMSDRMRRAYVIKDLISVLSLIVGMFKVDEEAFYQYVDSVVNDLLSGLSDNYSVLFNKYDALLSEYRELKRRDLELSASNRNLAVQTTQLSEDNKKLKEQLDALQKYSDSSLMAMIEDWIEVHSDTIDINEFARTYGIVPPRIEQLLDRMVSQGYLELKE